MLIDCLVLGVGVGAVLVMALLLGLFVMAALSWFAFGGSE